MKSRKDTAIHYRLSAAAVDHPGACDRCQARIVTRSGMVGTVDGRALCAGCLLEEAPRLGWRLTLAERIAGATEAIAARLRADPRYREDVERLGAMAGAVGEQWLEDGLAAYQEAGLTPSGGGSRFAYRLESLALSLGEIGRSLRRVFELLDHRAATSEEVRAGEALDQAARELVATVEEVASAMKTSAVAKRKEEGTG